MNEEFYRRQAEQNQQHERQQQATHSTMETYNLEQQEAHSGHIPGAQGEPAPEPVQLSLWERIKKLIGM